VRRRVVARTRISEKPGFGKERPRRQRFVQPASNATLIRWTGHQFISMRTNPGLTSSVVCWVAVALIVCFASAERRRLWHQHRRCTGDENSHLILPSGKTTGADEPGIGIVREFPARARSLGRRRLHSVTMPHLRPSWHERAPRWFGGNRMRRRRVASIARD
jgi:hypothetical protein